MARGYGIDPAVRGHRIGPFLAAVRFPCDACCAWEGDGVWGLRGDGDQKWLMAASLATGLEPGYGMRAALPAKRSGNSPSTRE